MKTDRELLELAGKAGDIPARVIGAAGGLYNCDERGWHRQWDPLTNDGDALRLAVKLGLGIDPLTSFGTTTVYFNGDFRVTEKHADDQLAATRRAIVRAAAEIGKAMP